MIITKRLSIIPCTESDIESIIEIEHHPDNRNFIWQGTYQEHLSEIQDSEHHLLKFIDKTSHDLVGYTLIHINHHSNIFELRRIAITKKGLGYGREALKALIQHAFDYMNINKLWLDVYPDNQVGIHLYESLGFVREGILRQNYKSDRGYLDQIIYSILREEYQESEY